MARENNRTLMFRLLERSSACSLVEVGFEFIRRRDKGTGFETVVVDLSTSDRLYNVRLGKQENWLFQGTEQMVNPTLQVARQIRGMQGAIELASGDQGLEEFCGYAIILLSTWGVGHFTPLHCLVFSKESNEPNLVARVDLQVRPSSEKISFFLSNDDQSLHWESSVS